MANKLPIIYESAITAMPSRSLTTSSTLSDTSLVTIDNSLTGNGNGCHAYQCYCLVTTAPSGGNATARLYYSGVHTGTPTNFDSGSLSVEIPSGETGTFGMGEIIAPDKLSRVQILAESFDFTASLVVVPVLPEAQ